MVTQVRLTVISEPECVTPPFLTENRNATLTCEVKAVGGYRPALVWRYDERALNAQSYFKVSFLTLVERASVRVMSACPESSYTIKSETFL